MNALLPVPHRIAGFALAASSLFVLVLLGIARRNYRGEIIVEPTPDSDGPGLRSSQSFAAVGEGAVWVDPPANGAANTAEQYFVFLQKFPLEGGWLKVYHTEVIVCPRDTFSADPSFLSTLDTMVEGLLPSSFDASAAPDATKSPFAAVDEQQWTTQTQPGCVQLGYGGANCGMGCCGSPHKQDNRNYALNSRNAVISNADGSQKELYLYGVSGSADGTGGMSGEDAYKAVCHGHMNALEYGKLPMCVSNWAGRDYNPLTNNCNTFTSTVLKCVYGFSDAKPDLGVSDLRTVTCPTEKGGDGTAVSQCVIPQMVGALGGRTKAEMAIE
ncbi:hypothetical protein ACHAXT_005294 [Thalassiosira profunda]